jgi:hypothetical protein
MNYTFRIDSENKMILVKTVGDLITNEVVAMGLEIMLKAKMLKYNILYDYRLSNNRISITEAYHWHSTHFDNIDKVLKRIPTAYIANREDWNFYLFFECTCHNKGIPIRAFLEECEAVKWLNTKISI